MITHIGGMEMSRDTVLMMMHADAADRAEARAREEAAEARREEALARAQAYYHEHGEWEWQTREREQDVLARAEARAEEQRRAEAAERHQAHVAQLMRRASSPGRLARFSPSPRCIPEAPGMSVRPPPWNATAAGTERAAHR